MSGERLSYMLSTKFRNANVAGLHVAGPGAHTITRTSRSRLEVHLYDFIFAMQTWSLLYKLKACLCPHVVHTQPKVIFSSLIDFITRENTNG